MKGFSVRGLEVHSARMWDYTQVMNTLDFMERYGLNTLIFHQNDLLDVLVFPEEYFPLEYMWKRFPPRYSKVLNNRYYINNIIKQCHARGIKFVPEVKELWFDEWIVELKPEVRGESGLLCPSHPFWWEYLQTKLDELFENVPGIDGIIVSPGTRESKLSISANRCGCDRCAAMTEAEWNSSLITTMARKLRGLDKSLIVRDFAFGAHDQTVVLQGVNYLPENKDVIMSLKNTPHDFYPTFPLNPAIGNSGHPEWIEFDTWGQFIGNGIFPVSIIEDMAQRMRESYEAGAAGIFLRSDWENMDDHCAFSSPNILNTIAGAILSQNIDADIDDIYREWALNYGMLSPLKPASFDQKPAPLADPEKYTYLRDFMKASWQVIEKTLFVRGHLFQDNSMYPYTMERCAEIMVKAHSMEEWAPGSSSTILPTDENLAALFAEKALAEKEAAALPEILKVRELGLPQDMVEDIEDLLDLYNYYVHCYSLCCKAYFYGLKARTDKSEKDRAAALAVLDEIMDYSEVVRARVERGTYTHEIPRMLDYKRLTHLVGNVRAHLAECFGSKC